MTKELIALLDGRETGRVVRDHRERRLCRSCAVVSELAGQLADHVSTVKQQMVSEGLNHPIIPRLAEVVTKRAAAIRKMIQRR